ncbi:MAG: NAD(P)-binding domain-containing protein [Pyrinomonadaceae bacterium]|nr:NAD(P)-binding domain-containing protein [Pyrinomonadaceae bacterium]
MRAFNIFICLVLLALLVWINLGAAAESRVTYGGLTVVGWLSIGLVSVVVGFIVLAKDAVLAFGIFGRSDREASRPTIRKLTPDELAELGLDKYRGPEYPHPVIFPERCIGCQACVDACPHDVLAIVDGTASAVAPDLCMDDTACQAECPVNPKACIIVNTTKDIRSLPTPTRDGASYETNVPGCYIIGDVSGVPLIKNAVKEGAEVIARIGTDIKNSPSEPRAQYDVAIVGIGPGGASAAASAADMGLRYVALEQNNILSTIDLYPKGKYIFFKPDTKDWFGGLPVTGLGLVKAKYGNAETDDAGSDLAAIDDQLAEVVHTASPAVHARLIAEIPDKLRAGISQQLTDKIEKELKKRITEFLRFSGSGDLAGTFSSQFIPRRRELIAEFSDKIADELATKIPGDQRENILNVWLGALADKGVRVNEHESCTAVIRSADGDYFTVTTERGDAKAIQSYTVRRVVIAIGLRGAPNKLRLPNEEMKVMIDGREQSKVIYSLSNPMDFRGRDVVIVGGGNVAVEAAVDLVAVRDGSAISSRSVADINRVTLLVREALAPTVKFGNKLQLYKCATDGLIDLRFGASIKKMSEREIVIEHVKTKQEVATIPNDYVFALIGGERPNRFLESIGITIK